MKEISDGEELLTRFLLGELAERERAEVEDRLLADEDFYERMLAAERDLTDAYVRGTLPAPESARFEETFLSSARRRERVEFARGLVESATRLHGKESASPRAASPAPAAVVRQRRAGLLATLFAARPALSYALAASAVVVVAVVVWLAFERMRAPVKPEQARTEDAAPRKPEQPSQDAARNGNEAASNQQGEGAPPPQESINATPDAARTPEPKPERETPRARPVFATITLAPGSLRDGAEGGNLSVPRAATHLRVRLQLEEDNYRSYRAIVSTPEGRKIWAGAARKDRATDAHSVTVTLPADTLPRGDYVVELSGVTGGRSEPAAAYSFRVTRED